MVWSSGVHSTRAVTTRTEDYLVADRGTPGSGATLTQANPLKENQEGTVE